MLKAWQRVIEMYRIGGARAAYFYYDAISEGEKELYDIYSADGCKTELLRYAASATADADYFYGAALCAAADSLGIPLLPVTDVKKERGGVRASFDFGSFFVGSRTYMKRHGVLLPEAVERIKTGGYSRLYVAENGIFAGFFLFCDRLADTARDMVNAFNKNGVKSVLLGDEEKIRLLKQRLGFSETRAAILKIEKEKVLQEAKKSDKIIVLDSEDTVIEKMQSFLIGKRLRRTVKVNILATAVLAAFCILFLRLPFVCAMAAANTAVLILYNSLALRRNIPIPPVALEEEKMFGKVQYTMHIGGMSCAHCSARVKGALESLRGVSADISLEEKVARIKCPASLDVNKLSDAVSGVGFTVVSVERV